MIYTVRKMKNKKLHGETLDPENIDYAASDDEFDTSEDYLAFASNGKTNNEHIDEYNYYDNYLEEDGRE